MGDGARALGELGGDIIHRPGVIPGKAHNSFRRWFSRVWKLRGGGLYAGGYAVTFVIMEVRSLTGDVVGSSGVVDFVTSQAFEFVFRFISDSFINMILAFIWPVYVIQFRPPWGLIGLGMAFLTFDLLFRKRIEKWLASGPDEPRDPPADVPPAASR